MKLYLDKTDRMQSLSYVHKLKYEHVYLTSFSKNPNSQEFFKNSQALRVIQACSTSVKGNCRGNTDVDAAEQTRLQCRNSHKS